MAQTLSRGLGGWACQSIYEAAAPGSRLWTRDAGHMQFADMGITQPVANLVCKANWFTRSGKVNRAVAENMVAWISQQMNTAVEASKSCTEEACAGPAS